MWINTNFPKIWGWNLIVDRANDFWPLSFCLIFYTLGLTSN